MKKIISIGVVLTLMLSLLPIGTVSAVTDGETVTKLVNVAKNKPVSTEHSRDESYDPQAIVDDNVSNNNFWYGYIDSTVKPNITIDLQRRYPIEKLRIFDRGNSAMPTRGEFEIWGADREDFSDARLLFELNDNSVFPEKLDYVIELSEKPVCRYVRYQAKNAAVVYLREIQVFSTVTATEISREAATYTTTNLGGGSSMAGDQLVDGDFTDSSALYLKNQGSDENLSGYFSTFTIDLGTNKYVDMIEMYNRRGGGATSGDYRGYFTVYGSNEGTITDFTGLSPDGATAYSKIDKAAFEALTQTDGTTPVYKALSGIPIAVSDYTAQDGSVYNAFPNRASDSDRACYQVTLDNSEAYRYLTYRKNKTAIGSGYNLVQIVEFRAYQINPEIYNITCENGKVILDCSD